MPGVGAVAQICRLVSLLFGWLFSQSVSWLVDQVSQLVVQPGATGPSYRSSKRNWVPLSTAAAASVFLMEISSAYVFSRQLHHFIAQRFTYKR